MGSNGTPRFVVNPPDHNRYLSVTERLAARLDVLEPIVARMLANETKLIADALKSEARMDAQDAYSECRSIEAGRYTAAVSEKHHLFVHRTFRQRLRWLLTGR